MRAVRIGLPGTRRGVAANVPEAEVATDCTAVPGEKRKVPLATDMSALPRLRPSVRTTAVPPVRPVTSLM